jgi:hypothetical protein
VPHYLRAAGHYEFGPQRVPIRLTHEAGDRISRAWQSGDDAAGYAIQWAEIYGFVNELTLGQSQLARRILVIRYEDLCDRPHEVIAGILEHAALEPSTPISPEPFAHIAPPGRRDLGSSVEFQESVWRVSESVARLFGYTPTPHDLRESGQSRKPAGLAEVAASLARAQAA